jgi:hypothetical protein
VIQDYIDALEYTDVEDLTRNIQNVLFKRFTKIKELYTQIYKKKEKKKVVDVTDKQVKDILEQYCLEDLTTDISALDTDNHEVIDDEGLYVVPPSKYRSLFKSVYEKIKKFAFIPTDILTVQKRLYLLYKNRHAISWRLANYNSHPEWKETKEQLHQLFAVTTKEIQNIQHANKLVTEYASLDNNMRNLQISNILEKVQNNSFNPVLLKGTYDQIVWTMYGFAMNMYDDPKMIREKGQKISNYEANSMFGKEIEKLLVVKLLLESKMSYKM